MRSERPLRKSATFVSRSLRAKHWRRPSDQRRAPCRQSRFRPIARVENHIPRQAIVAIVTKAIRSTKEVAGPQVATDAGHTMKLVATLDALSANQIDHTQITGVPRFDSHCAPLTESAFVQRLESDDGHRVNWFSAQQGWRLASKCTHKPPSFKERTLGRCPIQPRSSMLD